MLTIQCLNTGEAVETLMQLDDGGAHRHRLSGPAELPPAGGWVGEWFADQLTLLATDGPFTDCWRSRTGDVACIFKTMTKTVL